MQTECQRIWFNNKQLIFSKICFCQIKQFPLQPFHFEKVAFHSDNGMISVHPTFRMMMGYK